MQIAVVGAGLAGLSVSWYLSKSVEVTLFDAQGIGQGASGTSTGLMHPFPGRQALLSWNAMEAMNESLSLFDVAEEELGKKVYVQNGVFRPPATDKIKAQYQKRLSSDAIWKEDEKFGWGLWIPSGVAVYTSLYMEGLWNACKKRGVKFIQTKVESLKELESFDLVILALGHEILKFDECKHLDLEVVKGQALLCKTKKQIPFSLCGLGHITWAEDPTQCYIGSTYERNFKDLLPNIETAMGLMDQVSLFYPEVKEMEVVEVRAGARISRPRGYRPIAEKINEKTYVFTGLGSRGLLYHAFFAKKIAEDVISNG